MIGKSFFTRLHSLNQRNIRHQIPHFASTCWHCKSEKKIVCRKPNLCPKEDKLKKKPDNRVKKLDFSQNYLQFSFKFFRSTFRVVNIMNHTPFLVKPGKAVKLSDYDPTFTGKYKKAEDCAEKLQKSVQKMAKLQDILYAQNTYGLLIIIQAMDAAGKDSAVKHVFSGVNPQGCTVQNFKSPSALELDRDYLWRAHMDMPERGGIGIFNRSYYEEVLIARVHPQILDKQQLPDEAKHKHIWRDRFEQINAFEKHFVQNGILVLKFFLNVSKGEPKKRFLERIENPDKNWKFALSDVEERKHWNKYQHAYEEVFKHTSTKYAPWYIVPADNKWFTRIVLSDIINDTLEKLHLRYPEVSEEHKKALLLAKEELLQEKD